MKSDQFSLWEKANRELVAKSLSELLYEEVLVADSNLEMYFVQLKSSVKYEFIGKKGAWDFLQIDEQSIKRVPEVTTLTAAQFFLDAHLDLEMTFITLTHFMEEMNNTLYSEMKILENKANITTTELSSFSGEEIQAYLSGHPKILLNKGRIGFSTSDLEKYAPEYGNDFQVKWVAIKKELLLEGISERSPFSFTCNLLDKNDALKLINELAANGVEVNDYKLIPVHPWQFNRFIQVQFQSEIAEGFIIPLSVAGPHYTPQISIRTLADKKKNTYDLKLSLSILNTSAYRGIAADSIKMGPQLSFFIEDICKKDSLLASVNTKVLKEVYGASYIHPTYSQIKEAPYRYNELLGCVVRESAQSYLAENERAIMTGSLFYVGDDQLSLIGEYIRKSKLTAADWMRSYFKHVVLPLYHLQLSYGIGIVSHGQNIVLRLTDNTPSGMFIKDFQGDLRVSKNSVDQLPNELRDLKSLPPEYLIHDLITGHFVTVLRFISPILEKFNLLSEAQFYQILNIEIYEYLKSHHSDLSISSPLHLQRPEFEKVILNKVRFKIGYEDSASRPLPMLGKNLLNPLVSRNIL
jgi:aerobactin synthase